MGNNLVNLCNTNQLNVNSNANTGNINTTATVTATQQLQQLQQAQQQNLSSATNTNNPDAGAIRSSSLLPHKLSPNEITAARQVISAYRESAAFLLRTADQVEQLLIQQQ